MFFSLIAAVPHSLGKDALLHAPNFRRFWLSSALNGFGRQISAIAIPLCAALVLKEARRRWACSWRCSRSRLP